MHVKFEESNSLVKNIVDCEIDSLGEDLEKMSMDSQVQEEKPRDDANGEVQEVEVKTNSISFEELEICDLSKPAQKTANF